MHLACGFRDADGEEFGNGVSQVADESYNVFLYGTSRQIMSSGLNDDRAESPLDDFEMKP